MPCAGTGEERWRRGGTPGTSRRGRRRRAHVGREGRLQRGAGAVPPGGGRVGVPDVHAASGDDLAGELGAGRGLPSIGAVAAVRPRLGAGTPCRRHRRREPFRWSARPDRRPSCPVPVPAVPEDADGNRRDVAGAGSVRRDVRGQGGDLLLGGTVAETGVGVPVCRRIGSRDTRVRNAENPARRPPAASLADSFGDGRIDARSVSFDRRSPPVVVLPPFEETDSSRFTRSTAVADEGAGPRDTATGPVSSGKGSAVLPASGRRLRMVTRGAGFPWRPGPSVGIPLVVRTRPGIARARSRHRSPAFFPDPGGRIPAERGIVPGGRKGDQEEPSAKGRTPVRTVGEPVEEAPRSVPSAVLDGAPAVAAARGR